MKKRLCLLIFLLSIMVSGLFFIEDSHAIGIEDDFETTPTGFWTAYQEGTGPTVADTNGRLEITIPSDSAGGTFQAGYISKCKLIGDFDVYVDYQLLTWPESNGVRIGLGVSDLGVIERASWSSLENGGPREAYLTHFNDGVQGVTTTADSSGKLRLKRLGNTLTGYYMNSAGEWITIHSFTYSSAPDANVAINAWGHDNSFADQEVKIVFDNVFVNPSSSYYRSKEDCGASLILPAETVDITPVQKDLTIEPITINNGPNNQTDPHVSGDIVSYSDQASGTSQIRYYDFSTGVNTAIPNDGAYDFLSDVSGNTVVFTRVDPLRRIFAYDTSTSGPAVEIAPRDWVNRHQPAVGSHTVAWQERNIDGGFQTVVFDLFRPSDRLVLLLSNTGVNRYAAVSPNDKVVAWSGCAGTTCYIFTSQHSSTGWGTSVQITNRGKATLPDTNGQVVVYSDYYQGQADIFWQPVEAGGTEKRLNMSGPQTNPNISGDFITFDHLDETASTPNMEIMMYNIKTNTLYRLTNTPLNEVLNNIWVSNDGLIRVVYSVREMGEDNVYALQLYLPKANAGTDQTVHTGTVVTLDGSGSSDGDENYPLTYSWTITSMPDGSTAALNNADTVSPSFTADVQGDYKIELVVTDTHSFESAADEIIVSTTNTKPVADAGPDQSVVLRGTIVNLDGTQSWDDDGDTLTYSWTMTGKPGESTATLSGPSSQNPAFTADIQGTYTAELVVSDPWVSSDPDTVTVSFENIKPVANAGGNQAVSVGDTVVLYGGDSSDANGDSLTYNWSLVSTTAGSTATLADATSQTASFVADKGGTYVVSLVVNDGLVDSDPANATIMATSNKQDVIDKLKQIIIAINNLPCSSLKNCNQKNALTNKINAAIDMIEQGLYKDALDKLETDIIGKTDGCAAAGAPDKNDWLTDCVSQNQVYPLVVEAINLLKLLL